jgi:hypothetical protein
MAGVSDGSEKKTVSGGGQRKVKPGWFLLAYDDGESVWTRLVERDFNCARIGSWRLDLDAIPVAPDGGAEALGGAAGGGDADAAGEKSESESEYEEEEEESSSEEESEKEQSD